jgi:hypothetical protein
MNRLKRQSLESLTRQFLAEVSRLDFSPDEVKESLLQAIQAWQVQGSPLRIDRDLETGDL